MLCSLRHTSKVFATVFKKQNIWFWADVQWAPCSAATQKPVELQDWSRQPLAGLLGRNNKTVIMPFSKLAVLMWKNVLTPAR